MTSEAAIPGLWKGMFFEHYVFDPRTNFKEADLHLIAGLIDIEFEHDDFPHKKHFDGRKFSPKEDLTVAEFADILMAMKITVADEVLERLPKDVTEQFDEDGLFQPYDDFDLEDMNQFLTKLIKLRIPAEKFNTLPRHIQRQFIVQTRDGKSWRYGDRRPA